MHYPNIPRVVGATVSTQLATLAELQTVYGLRDVYTLLEIGAVDAHNRRALSEYLRKKEEE